MPLTLFGTNGPKRGLPLPGAQTARSCLSLRGRRVHCSLVNQPLVCKALRPAGFGFPGGPGPRRPGHCDDKRRVPDSPHEIRFINSC